MTVEFKSFGKIQRLDTNIVTVTEKIDGTNACVIIKDGEVVGAQSRNRMLDIHKDNMGFCNWVENNKESLSTLGDGYHYGEWAGPGIQKNPMNLEEKTLFLFNTFRFDEIDIPNVKVVPVLYTGEYGKDMVQACLTDLKNNREYEPEGVIVYFHVNRSYAKITYNGNKGKWQL